VSDLSEALRLFITNTGPRARLDVGGELDAATVGQFADHLALLVDAGTGDVDVDMAHVTFCDAATLRVLVTVHQQLRRRDRRLRVVNASRSVMRLLQLTGLDTMLGPIPDGDRRVRHLASRRAPDGRGVAQEGGTRCRSTSV
jgi:anti-sigma B factor antagonist